MQAIFILGMFGVFYTALAVLIAMVSTSSMKLKAERVDMVEAYFQDVEVAINEGYLSQQVDFASVNLSATAAAGSRLDGTLGDADPKRMDKMIAPYASWRPEEILEDPWGTPYYYRAITDMTPIFAFNETVEGVNSNGTVQAPITAFMLVSAGPDRAFEDYDDRESVATFPTTFNGIKRYASPENDAYEDNIVHVFTTMEPMMSAWNYAKAVHEKVVNVIADNYKRQYELFADTISTDYYENVEMFPSGTWLGNETAPDKGGTTFVCSSTYMNAWKDPNCNVPGVPGNGVITGNLTGVDGFPRFEHSLNALGIAEEVEAGLATLTFVSTDMNIDPAEPSSQGTGDIIVIPLVENEDVDTDWEVNYQKTLQGKDIIGGF